MQQRCAFAMLDTVLKTKLLPPALPRHFILRQELFDQLNELDEVVSRRLITITAPAGYGKSALVSSWFRSERPRPYQHAWLTLDEGDNDPARLIRNLGEAIQLAGFKLEQSFLQLLNRGQGLPPLDFANLLINQLLKSQERLVIVLDDVHRLAGSKALELVEHLVQHAPDNVHFLLTGRELPIGIISQLRLQGQLLELGSEELRFSADESQSYFDSFDSIQLSPAQQQDLYRITEGWVGGMQLASISLGKSSNVDHALQSMSGSSRNIADFLLAEVVSKLSTEVVDFMLRVSILERFNADCCRYVTGVDNADELLEYLEQTNLFLFPLDEQRNWYRFHALFADYLYSRAARTLVEELPVLRRRAAEWLMQHQFIEGALEQFLEAGELAFAAELLDAHAKQLMADGAGATLIQCADRLPEKLLLKTPNLQLERAYHLALQWQFEQARKVLKAVRRATGDPEITGVWEDQGHDPEAIYRDLIHHEVQLELLTDNMPQALKLSEEWLDRVTQDTDSFAIAVNETTRIFAQRECFGRVDLSQVPVIRARFTDNNALWGRIWHDTIIGATNTALGNLHQARQLCETALTTAHELVGHDSPVAAMAACHLAEVLYEQNEIERAKDLLQHYLPLAGQIGLMDQLIAGYVTACRIAQHEGEGPEKVLQLLNEAEEIGLRVNFQRLLTHITLERIRLYLSLGDLNSAQQVARADDISGGAAGFKPKEPLNMIKLLRAVAWSMLKLGQNKQLPEVINLLELWVKHLEGIGRNQSLLRVLLLLASAYLGQGDLRKAQRSLRKALNLGVYENFVRSFVDAGAGIRHLLESSPNEDASGDRLVAYRQQLLAACGYKKVSEVAETAEEDVPQAGAESLSRRETEVLALVGRGLSNDQLADELGLTIGTVKWHLHQIFLKLGVSRRAQAVHRARQLGMIQ